MPTTTNPASAEQVEDLLCDVYVIDNTAKDVLDLLDEVSRARHPGAAVMDGDLRRIVRGKMADILKVTSKILPG